MKSMIQKPIAEPFILLGVGGMEPEVRINDRLERFLCARAERTQQRVNLGEGGELWLMKQRDKVQVRTHTESLCENGSCILYFAHADSQQTARISSRVSRGFHSSGQSKSIVAIAASVSS
jgi:hypothetical protein